MFSLIGAGAAAGWQAEQCAIVAMRSNRFSCIGKTCTRVLCLVCPLISREILMKNWRRSSTWPPGWFVCWKDDEHVRELNIWRRVQGNCLGWKRHLWVQLLTQPCQVHTKMMFLSATSTHLVNLSREGGSTTTLSSLFQCLTTLSEKKFFKYLI